MSAVIRAYGEDFDVDAFLVDCGLPVCAVKRRGEPIAPRTKPESKRHESSGVHVLASGADFDEFPRQVAEATEFLRSHFVPMQRLVAFPGVTGVVIDFGVDRRDVEVQCDLFTRELVRLAGSLGLEIELSTYA